MGFNMKVLSIFLFVLYVLMFFTLGLALGGAISYVYLGWIGYAISISAFSVLFGLLFKEVFKD